MSIESYTCSVLRRVAEVFLLEQPAGRDISHLPTLAPQSDYAMSLCIDGAMDTKAERLPLGVELPLLLKKEP